MRTRRQFIEASLLSALPLIADEKPTIRLGCQTNAWPIEPKDSSTFFAALAQIRELGFEGFETGFANVLPLLDSRDRFRDAVKGLSLFGVHIFRLQYDPATLVADEALVLQVIDATAKLGFAHVILSGAPATPATLKHKADALNHYGQLARSAGLRLAYHNHGPEFKGATPEIDSLIASTNPDDVSFVLDAGHAFRAAANIPKFVKKHHQRLAGLHLRDFREGHQVPLGQGQFPLVAVAQTLIDTGWSGWVLAEEEREDGSKPGASAAGPAIGAMRQAFTR